VRLGFGVRVLVLLASISLAALAGGRGVVMRRSARADAARAPDSAAAELRRLPTRVRPTGPRGTDDAGADKGGPWYVICGRHPGGYCSDPYFDFDTATSRAELHRRRSNHFGVSVSTTCPY
jgi:hypothetical protein